MSNVIYHNLAEQPAWAEQCTAWDLTEWPRPAGLDGSDHTHYAAAACAVPSQTPHVIVAQKNNSPIGMISIVDLDDPSFRPWIISIYVIPEERGHGIFHGLVAAAVTHARAVMRVPQLYTYSHLPFEKWGWTRITDTPDPSGVHDCMTVFRMDF